MRRKRVKKILVIIGLIIAIMIVMFLFNICPPQGPWPTPPWCKISGRNTFAVSVVPTKIAQIKAINMVDTWGRNYNMSMFEDTRKNISESFDRVKELGAQEIYVHDFHRAIFDKGFDYTSTNYHIANETFWNDMRDQSITYTEIKKLVEAAHSRGLELGVKHNMAFVNIGKYIIKGIAGNIQDSVAKDYEAFNAEHSEEWITDYFAKWQTRMIEKGTMYQKAGVDIMSISPTWMDPKFAGHEALANKLQKQLIAELRKTFQGKIHVEISRYGFLEGIDGKENWTKYDFYKNADIIEMRIYDLPERFRNLETEVAIKQYIDELNRIASNKGMKLSIFVAPSSYSDSMKHGALEVLDYKSEQVKNAVADFDYQTLVFDTFFKALANANNIERINVASFAWDDMLDPQVKPKLSVASTFRNKPAEEVVKSWFNQK